MKTTKFLLASVLALTLVACQSGGTADNGGGEESKEEAASTELKFNPGTYTGTGSGYNGPVELDVTFDETSITDVQVKSSLETGHVGDVAFDIIIPDIIEANGTGVDSVSGATFSSFAVKAAVEDAATQAGLEDLTAFKENTVEHAAQEAIEDEWDVVIVGAGGAGISAAAQAAQDGNSVLVIEKNAEIGGNTLVSGGQYQSVMPYLVWEKDNPDAEEGTRFDGETFPKSKAVTGQIENTLKVILNWSEEPFDEDYYKDNEFVAGDIVELSKHGVHESYLPVLKELKQEISDYLAWAEPKIAAGTREDQLTLFSTINLHVFQTYYGGLRPSADGSEWIYGDVDLVKQFVEGGQDIKPWLMDLGCTSLIEEQKTLIGALWYRENDFDPKVGRWGTYFEPMMTAVNGGDEKNEVMLRTNAEELIVEDGKVTGVKATKYDGTPVTAKAKKGVILATGGYAANISDVVDTNIYWSDEYLSTSTKTTNRNSLQGDGIKMGEAVGADTTGMGFTQLMPISWIDNGNLAFGGGNYAIYVNPTTGKRFVDETSERDVLSLNEFKNGVEMLGSKGVFLEFANAEEPIPGPYLYGEEDVENRQWVRTPAEFADLFKELGLETDADAVIETIKKYDEGVMNGGEFEDVGKSAASRTIGNVEKNEDGSYKADTYDLDNTKIRIRLMAPSTHHTMGGLKVDVDRHVLDKDGNPVNGLYAAGEVTGGFHGGNRLGGNAIVEIIVSGRTAAKTVNADN